MIRTIRRALGTSTAGRSLPPALMGSATTRSSVIRQRLDTSYHGSGSCHMGSDAEAVVDSQGRVRAVGHMRVVDASIMPKAATANLNAPVMMAEKIADRIRGKTSLPPSNAPYYQAGR